MPTQLKSRYNKERGMAKRYVVTRARAGVYAEKEKEGHQKARANGA